MSMTTYRDEIFCSVCSANMALHMDKEVVEPASGMDYVKRTLYLICPNQNCPLQNKRQELPKA